jgi:hypothetical protein
VRFVRIQRSDGKIQRIETSGGQSVNFGYTNGRCLGTPISNGSTTTTCTGAGCIKVDSWE